jgi:Transcription factor WhiB
MENIPALVLLDNTRREYVLQAACSSANPGLFDTDALPWETRKDTVARIMQAKAVCAQCPVRKECLADAMVNIIETGIWGGLTPPERGITIRRRSGKRKQKI